MVSRSGDGSFHSDIDVALCRTRTMAKTVTGRMGRSLKEKERSELGFGPVLGFSVFADFPFLGNKKESKKRGKNKNKIGLFPKIFCYFAFLKQQIFACPK